jgi:hypothetical protein
MVKIKPITLEIEERVWKEFKSNVTRIITLNNKIVELINNFNKSKRSDEGNKK